MGRIRKIRRAVVASGANGARGVFRANHLRRMTLKLLCSNSLDARLRSGPAAGGGVRDNRVISA